MPQKDTLREMLSPSISGRTCVASVLASAAVTAQGIVLLARRDWIAGGMLVAAVLVGWASRIPDLWAATSRTLRSLPIAPKARPLGEDLHGPISARDAGR